MCDLDAIRPITSLNCKSKNICTKKDCFILKELHLKNTEGNIVINNILQFSIED